MAIKPNSRHLTICEGKILGAMIDECGAPEMLRVIAQRLACDIEDLATAEKIRHAINCVAKMIANYQK